jgi:ATP-dependent DNA ligase/predicted DNA-binding WGR domain protein
MNYYCELSKKDVKGADRIWAVTVQSATTTTTWGQKNGKMQIQVKEYKEGKQKRTPHEQAVFESKAIIVKKKREGWQSFERTQEQVETPQLQSQLQHGQVVEEEKKSNVLEVRPLLAKSFESLPTATPVFVQPKLDGMRCVADIETGTLWSRGGKVITELPRLESAVKALYGLQIQYLDGELYIPGKSFSELVSLVRNGSLHVQYHVYDCVLPAPFSTRHDLLKGLHLEGALQQVPTHSISSDDIGDWHNQFLQQGYEGTMIRTDKDKTYRQGARSSSLLKLKNFQDAEYLCTNIKQEKHEDTLGSLECVTSSGQVFHARPKLTDEERKQLWLRPQDVVNHLVTVKYFEITDAGVPRFPVVIKIRPLTDL